MNPTTFTWKAEIEFPATADEFEALTASLTKLRIKQQPGIKRPGVAAPVTFTRKGLIEFSGTPEEFNSLSDVLAQYGAKVTIPEWVVIDRPHLAGCNPLPIDDILDKVFLEKIKAQPRVSLRFNQDIRGGIRTPHVHLADEVAFLEKGMFKSYVGKVAANLAKRRFDEFGGDYIDVMAGINPIAATPINLP
jgi:hypothetical protein